jgi:hypothetical protein
LWAGGGLGLKRMVGAAKPQAAEGPDGGADRCWAVLGGNPGSVIFRARCETLHGRGESREQDG